MPLLTQTYYGQDAPYQPRYADPGQVADVAEQLRGMGPLVSAHAADALTARLAAGTFIIQGGDCVSVFPDDTQRSIGAKVRALRQMGQIIHAATGLEVASELRTGPAKWRSDETERVNGTEVLTYRGPAVHGWDPSDREPNPKCMLYAYGHAERIQDHLAALGFKGVTTAREAELLVMEDAMLGRDGYCKTADRLWVGFKTLGEQHVRFARRVRNPLAVKIGPGIKRRQIRWICQTLNPEGILGHLTLVTRFGAGKVHEFLPDVAEEILATGIPVLVQADLGHGNTRKVMLGGKQYKYRFVEDMAGEFAEVHQVLSEAGIPLTGVWVESTGESVTECLSRSQPLISLMRDYRSRCDPRLNPSQCETLAHRIAATLAS